MVYPGGSVGYTYIMRLAELVNLKGGQAFYFVTIFIHRL